MSEQEVVKTQPTSAKSKKSDEVSNKEMVENYVEDQTRRTSGKSNSHILSDNDNNPKSLSPPPQQSLHLSTNPTSSEIADVRSEIAQIQSVIENVKKEMVQMQMQKQPPITASPGKAPSRSQSVGSNNTYTYDENEKQQLDRPKTSMDIAKPDEPSKTRPTTAKSILKPSSPFHRLEALQPDDVMPDQASDSPIYDPTLESHVQEEVRQEDVVDDVDQSQVADDLMTDSAATISKDNEIDDDDATIDQNMDQAFSPTHDEVQGSYQRTPTNVKRQPPLKRNHKVTPVKNSMPNIQQPAIVSAVVKTHKVTNSLFPPTLRRFERPKDAIQTCLSQLESTSWEHVVDGLVIFVRLIRHHPQYVDAQIHLMTLAIAKHVKNLRSQVSRAACSASSEFFMTNAKSLDADAEELAAALLNRTADTNKFLRADALKALESMCDALHPSKVILILTFRGAAHQNAAVRCTTARLLNQLVFRNGCDKVLNLHKDIRDRLILTAANLLMEGSLETRSHTKEIFKQLSIHSHYQKMLLDVIPANVYRNIEKSLKSIR